VRDDFSLRFLRVIFSDLRFFLSRQCIQLNIGRKNIIVYRNTGIFIRYLRCKFIDFLLSFRLDFISAHCIIKEISSINLKTNATERNNTAEYSFITVPWANNANRTMKLPILLTLFYCFCVDVSHTREITYVSD